MISKKGEIIGIFGIKGHGKTSMIRTLIRPRPRVLILDDGLGDYDGAAVAPNAAIAAMFLRDRERFRVVFGDIDKPYEENAADAIGLTKAYVESMADHDLDVTLVIDEADLYASGRNISAGLRNGISRGRHWNLSIIYASRRPAEVHTLLPSQTERFIIFRTREPSDIRYLRSFIGEDAASKLPDLEKYQYIDVAADGEWKIGRMGKPT